METIDSLRTRLVEVDPVGGDALADVIQTYLDAGLTMDEAKLRAVQIGDEAREPGGVVPLSQDETDMLITGLDAVIDNMKHSDHMETQMEVATARDLQAVIRTAARFGRALAPHRSVGTTTLAAMDSAAGRGHRPQHTGAGELYAGIPMPSNADPEVR